MAEYRLIPGSQLEPGQRVKGMWAFYNEVKYHTTVGGKSVGRKVIACGQVQRRMGDRVVIEKGWDRIPLNQVWLLPADAPVDKHWPRWEWGTYKPLEAAHAKQLLQRIGVIDVDNTRRRTADAKS